MKEKIFDYENEQVKVTWDKHRCIHAEECVKGLPDVFDPDKRPWIQPENADKNELMEVIERCPTGALHYELKNEENPEKPPAVNTIRIEENGPVYIHGDITIEDMDGNVVLKDTRVAMCRCGASKNKPLCDNSHKNLDWSADDSFNEERLKTEPVEGKGGSLNIKLFKNAPFLVQGNYTLIGESGEKKEECSKKMSFCRCGASQTKPFCDGTHKQVGFESD